MLSDCFLYPSESPSVDTEWVEFGVAYRIAIRFTQAQQADWPDYIIRGLMHERMRMSLSGEIAGIAVARVVATYD